MKILHLCLALLLSLVSCVELNSPTLLRWSNSDHYVSQDQFLKDRYSCLQEASQGYAESRGYFSNYSGGFKSTKGVKINNGMFQACMMARGYRLNPEGRLFVPWNSSVTLE